MSGNNAINTIMSPLWFNGWFEFDTDWMIF